MKKVRLSLMAFALTIGVAGAFAQAHAQHKTVARVDGLWQEANPDGTTKIGGDTYADEAAARLATGCEGVLTPCATSVDAVDGPSTNNFIYHN